MKKKSRNLAKELKIQLEKFQEIKKLAELAEQEEKEVLDNTEKEIKELTEAHDIFCGVVLSPEDIASIVKLAIETGEKIKIPAKLYYNDDVEEKEKK